MVPIFSTSLAGDLANAPFDRKTYSKTTIFIFYNFCTVVQLYKPSQSVDQTTDCYTMKGRIYKEVCNAINHIDMAHHLNSNYFRDTFCNSMMVKRETAESCMPGYC